MRKTPCEEDPERWWSDKPILILAAAADCGRCPVKAECLAGAEERKERAGVWGGVLFNGKRRTIPTRRETCGRDGCDNHLVQPQRGRRKIFCTPECAYAADLDRKRRRAA